MDDLNSRGLFVDELQKLRVMDPDLSRQTEGLKEECGGFVRQMAGEAIRWMDEKNTFYV